MTPGKDDNEVWHKADRNDIEWVYLRIVSTVKRKSKKSSMLAHGGFFGDPYGTRTHVTAVKGRCLNHLTNGPGSGNLTRTDDNTGMNRVLYQLSYAAILRHRPGRDRLEQA